MRLGSGNKLSEETERRIVKMLNQGITGSVVAHAIGVSLRTVKRIQAKVRFDKGTENSTNLEK